MAWAGPHLCVCLSACLPVCLSCLSYMCVCVCWAPCHAHCLRAERPVTSQVYDAFHLAWAITHTCLCVCVCLSVCLPVSVSVSVCVGHPVTPTFCVLNTQSRPRCTTRSTWRGRGRINKLTRTTIYPRSCLTASFNKVVLQKSIPAQIRRLILYYYYYKG